MLEDTKLIWFYLSNLIRGAFEYFIPVITIRDNNQPPWFNPDIRHLIKCICTLRHKHKIILLLVNLEHSKQLLQEASTYECKLVSEFANNNNSKKNHKYIRSQRLFLPLCFMTHSL